MELNMNSRPRGMSTGSCFSPSASTSSACCRGATIASFSMVGRAVAPAATLTSSGLFWACDKRDQQGMPIIKLAHRLCILRRCIAARRWPIPGIRAPAAPHLSEQGTRLDDKVSRQGIPQGVRHRLFVWIVDMGAAGKA